jgi:ABC-2 type transport system ATP-binding protein
MSNYALTVENVSKQIKDREILHNINLKIPSGIVCGITGHNGSGKSMLLRTITGLVKATQGVVTVLGKRIGEDIEFSPDIGAIIDIPGFLPRYSGFENLNLLAMIRGIITKNEIKNALRRVGLDPDDTRLFKTYSTGMRQRLGIAQAIMERPSIILLDEPTRGIDMEGHEQIYRLIKDLNEEGVTFILTSHYANELSGLCDEVYIMNQGKLSVSDGFPQG